MLRLPSWLQSPKLSRVPLGRSCSSKDSAARPSMSSSRDRLTSSIGARKECATSPSAGRERSSARSHFSPESRRSQQARRPSLPLLAISPAALRRFVVRRPELGDLILRTMVARREWLAGHGYGQDRLIGSRWSGDAFSVRDLLQRNLVPFTWHDLESDSESQALLRGLGVAVSDCPVLVRSESVIGTQPSRIWLTRWAARAGRSAGFRCGRHRRRPGRTGNCGLRGFRGPVDLVAERFAPGGQAGKRTDRELSRFPTGLSGSELSQRATLQARKFDAVLSSVHEAVGLSEADGDGVRAVALGDGQIAHGRHVVLATGADYRRLRLRTPSPSKALACTTPPRTSRRARPAATASSWWAAATRPGRP